MVMRTGRGVYNRRTEERVEARIVTGNGLRVRKLTAFTEAEQTVTLQIDEPDGGGEIVISLQQLDTWLEQLRLVRSAASVRD